MSHSIPSSRESERVQTSLRSTAHPHQPPRAQVTLPAASLSPFSAQSPPLARGPGTDHSSSSSYSPPGQQGESADLEIEIARQPTAHAPARFHSMLPFAVSKLLPRRRAHTHARTREGTSLRAPSVFTNNFAANENENASPKSEEATARERRRPSPGGGLGRARQQPPSLAVAHFLLSPPSLRLPPTWHPIEAQHYSTPDPNRAIRRELFQAPARGERACVRWSPSPSSVVWGRRAHGSQPPDPSFFLSDCS